MSKGRVYPYLYVVTDVFQDDVGLEPGMLIAWDNHGSYYTITTFNLETREIKPLANIYLVKRMTREEVKCLEENVHPCKCIQGLEHRLRERLLDAAKVFSHINGRRIDELYERALENAGCREPTDSNMEEVDEK
ncbi:MAG: hypothetical protein GSR84_08990 [Desulfurococcales archaeon]|nr:hypothetical protein [Desulfurococcales archaeon]